MNSPTQILSYEQAEVWVFHQLRKRGHKPQFTEWNTPNCDLKVGTLPIEVKFARPTVRAGRQQKRWQFYLSPTSQQMTGEWVAILVAQDLDRKKYPFIVPGSMFKTRTHVQLTSHPTQYRGWLAKFRNRWDVIDYIIKETYRNRGPLLNQWAGRVSA